MYSTQVNVLSYIPPLDARNVETQFTSASSAQNSNKRMLKLWTGPLRKSDLTKCTCKNANNSA